MTQLDDLLSQLLELGRHFRIASPGLSNRRLQRRHEVETYYSGLGGGAAAMALYDLRPLEEMAHGK